MTQEKKTTGAQPEQNQQKYTEPGVYGLIETTENGLAKAILVYPAGQDYLLEMYKHFNSFLENYNVLDIHLTFANMYLTAMDLSDDDVPEDERFLKNNEEYNCIQLLDFLSKIATEVQIHNKMLRIAKREATKVKIKNSLN